jgi:hypothetical protein
VSACTVNYCGRYIFRNRRNSLTISLKTLKKECAVEDVASWTYLSNLEAYLKTRFSVMGHCLKNNTKIIERWQNKKLRLVLNADWYVINNQIDKETGMLKVSEEIRNHSRRYQTRLENHPNLLANNLLDNSEERTRLRRHGFLDLPYRFSE